MLPNSAKDPLRPTFGFVIESGDGPTVIRPRTFAPARCIQLCLLPVGVHGVFLATGFVPINPMTLVVPLIAFALFVPLVAGAIWLVSSGERQRGPLLAIDHGERVARLPRTNHTFPFVAIRAIQRHFYFENRGDGTEPQVELALIVACGVDEEEAFPFLRSTCLLSLRGRVPRSHSSVALAERLAEELDVGLRDVDVHDNFRLPPA